MVRPPKKNIGIILSLRVRPSQDAWKHQQLRSIDSILRTTCLVEIRISTLLTAPANVFEITRTNRDTAWEKKIRWTLRCVDPRRPPTQIRTTMPISGLHRILTFGHGYRVTGEQLIKNGPSSNC